MSAPIDDPVCLCGDPKSQHRLGRKGCKALDCGCGEFEQAEAPIDLAGLEHDLAELESTDPAVGRTAQRLSDVTARIIAEARPKTHLEAVKAERDKAVRVEQSTSARLREVERELAAIRQELAEHVRAVDAARKERDEWKERALHFEERAVDQLVDTVQAQRALAAEIHGWDAWQCFTCGSRYRRDFDHEHGPLKPVRVSITER